MTRTFDHHPALIGFDSEAILELYHLRIDSQDPDAVPAFEELYFANWHATGGQNISYGGQEYVPVPLQTSGFEMREQGVPPNPSIVVGNIGLAFTSRINRWDDLVGARITRRRVLRQFLDDGSNPDPNGHWPDEIWYIEQKESEDKLTVTFRLSSPLELDGVMIPRRRALKYACIWRYRGPECGYTGPPVADEDDNEIKDGGGDALLQTYLDAQNTLRDRIEALSSTRSKIGELEEKIRQFDRGTTWTLAESRYSSPGYASAISPGDYYVRSRDTGTLAVIAVWNGNRVTLDSSGTYRRGSFQESKLVDLRQRYSFYRIDRYVTSKNNSEYNSLQSQLSSLKSTESSEESAVQSAKTAVRNAYNAYLSSNPAGDPRDQCGKQLKSCRLRFRDEFGDPLDLPWGGFPGLDIAV